MKNTIRKTEKGFDVVYDECPKCGSTDLETLGTPGGDVIFSRCKKCKFIINI